MTVGTGLLNPHTGREIVTKTNQLNKCIDVATIPRIAKQIGSFWSKLKSFKLNGVSQPIEKGFFSPSELSRRITAATITRQVGLKAIKRVSQVIVEAKWTTKWSLRPVPDLSRPGDAQPESRTAATTSVTATAEQQASSSDNEVASNPTTTAAVTPAVASAVGTGSFPTVLETVESGVITFSPVYCLPSSIAITTDADVWVRVELPALLSYDALLPYGREGRSTKNSVSKNRIITFRSRELTCMVPICYHCLNNATAIIITKLKLL